jgi:Rod binding domain-containing protein
MNLGSHSISPRVQPSNLPLDRLAASKSVSEEEKLGVVGQQFEAMLLRQMLQEAQKTVVPSRFSMRGAANSVYQDMISTQLAEGISRSGGFGLANSLAAQMSRQVLGVKESASAKTTEPVSTHDSEP